MLRNLDAVAGCWVKRRDAMLPADQILWWRSGVQLELRLDDPERDPLASALRPARVAVAPDLGRSILAR